MNCEHTDYLRQPLVQRQQRNAVHVQVHPPMVPHYQRAREVRSMLPFFNLQHELGLPFANVLCMCCQEMANDSCICACVISGTWESTNFVFRDIIFQIAGSDNCEAPIWVQKFPGSHHSFRIGWQRVQVCALVPVAPQFFGYIKRFKRALNSWHAQRLANSTERFGWTRKNIERGGD